MVKITATVPKYTGAEQNPLCNTKLCVVPRFNMMPRKTQRFTVIRLKRKHFDVMPQKWCTSEILNCGLMCNKIL